MVISVASSARRAHMVTGEPPSARTFAKVVPQLPAPSTTILAPRCASFGESLKPAGLFLIVDLRVPALLRRLLPPEVLEQCRDGVHHDACRLREGTGVQRATAEGGQVHRVADPDPDGLPRE